MYPTRHSEMDSSLLCFVRRQTDMVHGQVRRTDVANSLKKTNLPSCRHTGLSLGFQLREPLKCLTQSFLEVPLSLYPSWQWNRTTTLSKKTPALGVLQPCSGAPGSGHACRSSNPVSDKDTIQLNSFTSHAFSIFIHYLHKDLVPSILTTSNPAWVPGTPGLEMTHPQLKCSGDRSTPVFSCSKQLHEAKVNNTLWQLLWINIKHLTQPTSGDCSVMCL